MNDMLHARVPRVNTWESDYLDLLKTILRYGEHRADRTGTGTKAIFGDQLRIDLANGFPAVTTKKLAWKAMATELQWFIEGSGDERRLAEILHGSRDPEKRTIWTDNAQADYWKPKAKYDGDLGSVYGVQWRHWKHMTLNGYGDFVDHPNGGTSYYNAKVLVQEVDQLKRVVETLKTNHTDRRIILSAWNPGELDQMALPPCHMFAQFYLSNDRRLSCQMYQRSVDSFLGLPFNIASYALLTHQIAHVIDADVGELIMILGDTHVYMDHLEQVQQQVSRLPFPAPMLKFNRKVENIEDFRLEDFELVGYESQSAITAKMSA